MHVLGQHMQIQTKFLWLPSPVALGDQIDGWRVSWIGGWDRCRVFFVVMVAKEDSASRAACIRDGFGLEPHGQPIAMGRRS